MHHCIYMYIFIIIFLTGVNKKHVQTSLMDANLIRVAPEHCDMGMLVFPYHIALGWEAYLPI
jgi:hypothetical protein